VLRGLIRRVRGHDTSRGQSFVEFALILPVILLLLMVAIDFGRIYLGYINLQQMARVAAGFASEHASSWDVPGDAADQAEYQTRIANDASLINCELPTDGSGDVDVADPGFPDGFDLGDRVQVELHCNFTVLTPIISSVFNNNSILVSANATYPVREGAVSGVAGGGGPTIPPPEADFVGTPLSGYSPLDVTLTDTSTGSPTSWVWTFGNGNSFSQGPHLRTYTCSGAPGDTCTYTVSLEVGNPGGFDTETKTAYITVEVPPDTGPIAEFTGTPRTGTEGVTVDFSFVDVRGGTVNYTNWAWDFDGNGTIDSTAQNPSHTYNSPGAYTVSLTVTDDTGATDSQTKVGYIIVSHKVCTVPDFANVRRNSAQALWSGAGFSTTVEFQAGQGNYKIHSQTITGGTIDPQPDGCDSQIIVGP
jgi:PKD repeat protein